MRGFAAFARDRSGATALEFALVVGPFLMLLMGGFNAGYALYSGAAVRNAVQGAARTLILSPNTTSDALTAKAKASLVDVPVQNLAVRVAKTTVSGANVANVSWTYDYPLSVPLLPSKAFSFGSSVTVPLP